MFPYNKKLNGNARFLRRNMTPEEKRLWYDFLKKIPYSVKRQHIIGDFIVDFYIPAKKIVIEIDGIQHTSEKHKIKDSARDLKLAEFEIFVLRYTNLDINTNFYAVANDILFNIGLTSDDLID